MKRKIASRKLKRKCEACGRSFKKGDVYYIHRYVCDLDDAGIAAIEFLECAKCMWKFAQSRKRRETLQERCTHPHVLTHYTYIPGEYVQEPDHDYCAICGKKAVERGCGDGMENHAGGR